MTFFLILKRRSIQIFLDHINGVDDQICFTLETEREDGFSFPDVAVQREAGRLRASVYRKPTSTDRVLSFNSHHAWNAKAVVVHALMNKLEMQFPPDDEDGRKEERQHIMDVLHANGYQDGFIHRIVRRRERAKERKDASVDKG